MSFVAEEEFCGLLTNTREGEVICTTIEELGQKQLPTTITIDKLTTISIINDTIKKNSKATDMKIYWIQPTNMLHTHTNSAAYKSGTPATSKQASNKNHFEMKREKK